MDFFDEKTRLSLVMKDDLRQRDLNNWSAALREWRGVHQVADVPLDKLSLNEYNCAVLYAAIKANWIQASGRKTPDPEQPTRLLLTEVDALPVAAEVQPDTLDDYKPGVVQWYGERARLVYASLFSISPN